MPLVLPTIVSHVFVLPADRRGYYIWPEISIGYFILLNYMSAGYFVILACFYVLDSLCEWKIRHTGLYVITFLALRIQG